MHTRIQKWGNSLALRIPKSFAEETQIELGSTVDLSINDGTLVVRPVDTPRYRLEDLVAKIAAENLHEEISTGSPVGREAL